MDTNETHPLLQKPLLRVKDWTTWKRLWNEAEYVQQLEQLLHIAFDVEPRGNEWEERLCFLLRVADGHKAFISQWRVAIERVARDGTLHHDHCSRVLEATQSVPQKAFKVLCEHYFKFRCDGNDRYSLSPLDGLSPKQLETLLWFFCDHDRRQNGRNLPEEKDGHLAVVVRAYVLELIKKSWAPTQSSRSDGTRVDEDMEAACIAARPKYVVLLYEIDNIGLLYTDKLNHIDEATLEAFRRLALFENGVQKYANTEQATANCAGRNLLVLEARLREKKRQDAIEDAERRARQAQRDLEKAKQA